MLLLLRVLGGGYRTPRTLYNYYIQLVATKRDWMHVLNLKFGVLAKRVIAGRGLGKLNVVTDRGRWKLSVVTDGATRKRSAVLHF